MSSDPIHDLLVLASQRGAERGSTEVFRRAAEMAATDPSASGSPLATSDELAAIDDRHGLPNLAVERSDPAQDQSGGRRRQVRVAIAVLAAAAVAAIFIGLSARGTDQQGLVTDPGEPIPHLVPQAVPGDWLLTSVSALPLSAEAARNDIAMARWPKVYEAALWTDDANTKPSSTSRIIRVSIVALIDTPLTGDPRDAAEPLLHDQPGYSTVNWSTDEAVLTLAGRNVTSSELAAVGADLTVDGTEVAGTPPAGFHDALPPTTLSPTSPLTFGVGLTSYGAGMINDQTTGYLTKFVTAVDRGLTDVGSTSVTRTSADRLWLAYLSSPQPVQTTELDGAPAFSIATTCADLLAAGSTNPNCTSNDESYTIFWWREPTVLVSVSAYNEADARSVAASLTPVDHDTWDDYVSSAQTPIAGTPGE